MSKSVESKRATGREWSPPALLKVTDNLSRVALEELRNSDEVFRINDSAEIVADELFELYHPDQSSDDKRRAQFVADRLNQENSFGTWVHFPWNGQLTRYLDKEEHQDLRTYRNRNLVTKPEQAELLDKHVAIFGLSVGSNAALSLSQGGVGGKYTLADFDIISPTNLNRLRATMEDVGTSKIDYIAQEISGIDPYVAQNHLRSGYNAQAEMSFDIDHPDVIIEEADSLEAKVRAREFARERHIPLVMATDIGKKTVIDIEDYRNPKTKPFNGRISHKLYDKLLNDSASDKEQKRAKAQMAGIKHLSPRLIDSFLQIDSTLAGLPQLGSVATIGGAAITDAVREILLHRSVASGEYVIDPQKLMKFQKEAGIVGTARAYASLFRNIK